MKKNAKDPVPEKIYNARPNIYKYLRDNGTPVEVAEEAQRMSSEFALNVSIKYEAYYVKKIQEKKLARIVALTDQLHELATDVIDQEYPHL